MPKSIYFFGCIITVAVWMGTNSIISYHKSLHHSAELKLPADTIVLSPVHRGDTVEGLIKISNLGDDPLRIVSVRPSCGCTVASLVDSIIPAHSSRSTLRLIFNSSGKPLGKAVKTVSIKTDAPLSGSADLAMACMILEERKMHSTDMKTGSIFSSSCAKCHSDNGVNKLSHALYAADCAICHDSPNMTFQLKKLDSPKTITMDRKKLEKTIAFGIRQKGMPGFSKQMGGPLDSFQVASLVDYLEVFRKH